MASAAIIRRFKIVTLTTLGFLVKSSARALVVITLRALPALPHGGMIHEHRLRFAAHRLRA
jgi:hypothetical protein